MKKSTIRLPSKDKIEFYLSEAKKNNPGLWYKHSLNAARAAFLIACKCGDMDADAAYAMGALHDIGRREGVSQMHHVIAGYDFMIREDYPDIARVCITHSYTTKNIKDDCAKPDCSPEELIFLQNYIDKNPYTDYDRLIQLCDCIAVPEGFCLMEKRMVEVVLRYGFNERTLNRWNATISLKEYFEKKIGKSIYSLLPGVVNTTFGFDLISHE